MAEDSHIRSRVEEVHPGAMLESVVQGWVYLEDFDRGIEAYRHIETPTADDDRWLGVCHFQRVEDALAQQAFERAITKGQQAARVNLAHLLRMSDRADRATDELQNVDFARLTPYDQVFFLRVKSIHEETNGNLREALRFSEEAWRRLQGIPEFSILAPSILSQLGILHGRIGRAQRAIWFLERGIQLTSGLQQLKARIRWATVLVAQGRTADATEALANVDPSMIPEPMTVEVEWLKAEIAWLLGNSEDALQRYAVAIAVAQRHNVVYEEFLCQLALSTIFAFRGEDALATEHLQRAQGLVSDRSDQLTYRFREILIFSAIGLYRDDHAIRELLETSEAFGDMGLLQEQGFVRFHICHLKKRSGDSSYTEELDAIYLLAKSLQNPAFLERELRLVPTMKDVIEMELPA
ncbi:MAG: hypothetical protein U5J97_08990 [Trueperaceae bacterium]|nr:hypothetical protein [Trueperaceae bacterium]